MIAAALVPAGTLLVGLALAGPPSASTTPPCRIPAHALVVSVRPNTDGIGNDVAIYDRAGGSRTCEIVLPRGAPPVVDVERDGRIFVAVRAEKATNFSTDSGHLDVIGPDGRLLHRYDAGMEGIDNVALDHRGQLFVSTGWPVIRNGAEVGAAPSLTVYDSGSMKPIRKLGVEPDFGGDFTLSPDGRRVVAEYNLRTGSSTDSEGRIEIFDSFSGTRLVRLPVHSLATGAVLGTRAMPNKTEDHAGIVAGGVRYQQHDGSARLEYDVHGPTLMTTTTIARRDLASRRSLPPILVEGSVASYVPVDPNPALASAQPGAETRSPAFPSLDQLRAALPAGARGIQFDDAISGKRYAYLGTYARVDDAHEQTMKIVDCSARRALIADTARRTYRVVNMEETTIDEPSTVDDWMKHLEPPASAEVSASAVDRARLRSSFATAGYRTRVELSLPSRIGPVDTRVSEAEYEYAAGAAPPSCARHTFGGEPLGLEPDALRENVQAYDALRGQRADNVHVTGAPPPIPPDGVLVHMEAGLGEQLRPVFDARNLRAIDAGALAQFAAPPGYRAQVTVPY